MTRCTVCGSVLRRDFHLQSFKTTLERGFNAATVHFSLVPLTSPTYSKLSLTKDMSWGQGFWSICVRWYGSLYTYLCSLLMLFRSSMGSIWAVHFHLMKNCSWNYPVSWCGEEASNRPHLWWIVSWSSHFISSHIKLTYQYCSLLFSH